MYKSLKLNNQDSEDLAERIYNEQNSRTMDPMRATGRIDRSDEFDGGSNRQQQIQRKQTIDLSE